MNNKRTHVVLAEQLVKEIDTIVGRRRRSSFLTQAAERELMRLKQQLWSPQPRLGRTRTIPS